MDLAAAVKDVRSVIPEYLKFWLAYWEPVAEPLRSDAATLEQLSKMLLVSIALSMAVVFLGTRLGMPPITSPLANVVAGSSLLQVFAIALITIVAIGLLFHIAVVLYSFLPGAPTLPQGREATIIATLGFYAFAGPLFIGLIVYMSIADASGGASGIEIVMALLIASVLYVVYVPGSLAAAHRISFAKAFAACLGASIVFTLLSVIASVVMD